LRFFRGSNDDDDDDDDDDADADADDDDDVYLIALLVDVPSQM